MARKYAILENKVEKTNAGLVESNDPAVNAWHNFIADVDRQAEAYCVGYYLNDAGRAAGIDGRKLLFGRDDLFEKYASPELRYFFDEYPHLRTTRTRFISEWRRAAAEAKEAYQMLEKYDHIAELPLNAVADAVADVTTLTEKMVAIIHRRIVAGDSIVESVARACGEKWGKRGDATVAALERALPYVPTVRGASFDEYAAY